MMVIGSMGVETTRFFVVPPLAGLLRITRESQVSGQTGIRSLNEQLRKLAF